MLAAWTADATMVKLFTVPDCNGKEDKILNLVDHDENACFNKLMSGWKSYEMFERNEKEPELYMRTYEKINCGKGRKVITSCHDVGPKGGLKVGECVNFESSHSIGQLDKEC